MANASMIKHIHVHVNSFWLFGPLEIDLRSGLKHTMVQLVHPRTHAALPDDQALKPEKETMDEMRKALKDAVDGGETSLTTDLFVKILAVMQRQDW